MVEVEQSDDEPAEAVETADDEPVIVANEPELGLSDDVFPAGAEKADEADEAEAEAPEA